ncbi:MAG: cobalamin biosynthesis protein CobD [Desulfobacterales bacterium]|nr:cobalamin biosynthesis protein CobD [Desulfobacterales bacterium]
MFVWYIIPLAFALDLAVGDPHGAPHPVRWMGRAIGALEPRFRALPLPLTVTGLLFAVSLVAAVWILTWAVVWAAGTLHPALGAAVTLVAVYFCISTRDLAGSALAVDRALKDGGLVAAREKLAMIVGRDVRQLDETAVARAAVETVAENLVDGVMAPLFFAALGGAPLAMAYKMVNTLDSMVGYKNERYREFGRGAARIDDGANFIPARLSVPVIALAAWILGGPWRRALKTGFSQGRHHASPNAGFPEAAFAGALGVRLGGPNVYHGRIVDKPYIGKSFGDVRPTDIHRACRLMSVAALLWMTLAGGASWMLHAITA